MEINFGRTICKICGIAFAVGCIHACFIGDVNLQDSSTMPLYGGVGVTGATGVSGAFNISVADSQGMVYDVINPDAVPTRETADLVVHVEKKDIDSERS